jgi:hypothetical protein
MTRGLLPALLLLAAGAGVLYAFGGEPEQRADPGVNPAARPQTPEPVGARPKADHAGGPWGTPVDGLAARLVLQPRYAIGQPLSAVIEVKNTSQRTRYLVPRFDPHAIDFLTLEIVGPNGQKVRQSGSGRGFGLGENSFQPLGPGQVQRYEVPDLRIHFNDLEPWTSYPTLKARAVAAGKYRAQFRFRSPKVPDHFIVRRRWVDGKFVIDSRAPSKELVAGQWAGEVASASVAFELVPLGKDDLVVHEWGVFTVFNDVKYANANRKEEWGSLPSFFYRQFPKVRLRWVPAGWDKPVVYFYAKPEALRVGVKVTFREGAPVVWWPAAASPVNSEVSMTPRMPRKNVFRSLTWEAWVGERVPAGGLGAWYGERVRPGAEAWTKVKEFPLPAGCWLREARLPDAAPLTVVGNFESLPPGRRIFPGALDRRETERFLYYDGLVPSPSYIRCEKVEAGALVLRNRARWDITRLFVVDRRGPQGVRFAFVDRDRPLRAGTAQRVELKVVVDWPTAGTRQVRAALRDAGLFAAEADALLKIWHRRLLEADGVTVFHILPPEEYERMLPLEIQPAPAVGPVRVGIALHPHMEIEPDLATRVTSLIRQLAEPKFGKRAAASKELLAIGPLAIALLRTELEKAPPLEMRRRIESILERVDAAEWLSFPAPAKKP